jgi:CheY-like chemotaxis protein
MELEALGYRVVGVASKGADALARIREIRPDLIVLDVRLADRMSGVEVAVAVREFTCAPIIFVTGYDLELVPQIKGIHRSKILQKPVNARTVHEAALPLWKN